MPTEIERTPALTRPMRFITRMIAFLVAVVLICVLIAPALAHAFMGNPALNGIILGATLVGAIYIFRQVLMLNPEVEWIERFRRNQAAVSTQSMPRLLSPMARMLGDRAGGGGRVSLSA